MMTADFYRFEPIYQERVWGGRKLARAFTRELPPAKPIGESWEIVDRPEAQSRVAQGPDAGCTLRQIMQRDAGRIMGPDWPVQRPFPILVKWLDCRERLSLQVHPPQAVAAALGGEPKTEHWYMADTEPDAAVIAGIKRGVTRRAFENALRENRLEELVHRIPVQRGDGLFVPSGRLHAIDAGNLILEIQQNSDTTYRVYDWGRVGLDGKPRQLHVEASLKCIDFDDIEPAVTHVAEGDQTLAESNIFRLRKQTLGKGDTLAFRAGSEPHILSLITGQLDTAAGDTLVAGDNVLIPWAGDVDFICRGTAEVLITDRF